MTTQSVHVSLAPILNRASRQCLDRTMHDSIRDGGYLETSKDLSAVLVFGAGVFRYGV